MAKMSFKKRFDWAASLFVTAAVFVLASFTVGTFGCKMTEAGVELYSREVSSPQIVSFSVLSENEVSLNCTKPVKFGDLKLNGEDKARVESNGKNAVLNIEDGTEVGKDYVLEGVAYDDDGSSLTFELSFVGYNSNPAVLVLSEVRSEISKSSSKKSTTGIYNEEYVELLCIGSGNVSGLEIVSGYDGEEKKYVFPSLEVEKGDYITVHYRTRDDITGGTTLSIDETTGDKTLSKHRDSCDTAWDLWIKNSERRIGKTDVIVLKNGFSGKILDAVLYSESEVTKWKNDFISALASSAFEEGLWEGGADVSFAASSLNVTATRTISRQDLNDVLENGFTPGSKEKWKVTATSTASPGKPNSNKLYLSEKS